MVGAQTLGEALERLMGIDPMGAASGHAIRGCGGRSE
jgi:hypothetical protein